MNDEVSAVRRKFRNVNGILLLDKPVGVTSNGALQTVKRLFQARKAGHTGSLDPLASGLLPLCFGSSTKISAFLLEADKRYQVTVKLGIKTTTGDAEGEVIATRDAAGIDEEAVRSVLPRFTGAIQQIPPMHSAIKHQGQPLYKLAHQGIEIERQARDVTIHELRLVALRGARGRRARRGPAPHCGGSFSRPADDRHGTPAGPGGAGDGGPRRGAVAHGDRARAVAGHLPLRRDGLLCTSRPARVRAARPDQRLGQAAHLRPAFPRYGSGDGRRPRRAQTARERGSLSVLAGRPHPHRRRFIYLVVSNLTR